ncbi:MAG: hypothetical protein QXN35_06890 [Ignisphaera sp.]
MDGFGTSVDRFTPTGYKPAKNVVDLIHDATRVTDLNSTAARTLTSILELRVRRMDRW